MKNENCPVCGQPLIIFHNRCANCNTFYCDLTSLDLQEREPFILKYKINNIECIQYVKPEPNNPRVECTVERKSKMTSDLIIHDIGYQTKNLNTTFTLTALPFGEQDNLLIVEIEGENDVI